jgi:hypothetical protein
VEWWTCIIHSIANLSQPKIASGIVATSAFLSSIEGVVSEYSPLGTFVLAFLASLLALLTILALGLSAMLKVVHSLSALEQEVLNAEEEVKEYELDLEAAGGSSIPKSAP